MLKMQFLSAFAAAMLSLAGCGRSGASRTSGAPTFNTDYQAVLLDTGLVYYGRITGLDTDYPVLHDVYYVQQTTDATTKQVSNILIRRGNEWHSPEMTVLNARHIVLVEPVGPNSKVAQLIAADQKKNSK
ncbi:MAG: hypothetical protein JO307_20705 [Bryobacterales bacterium]|nr:hypothetical protein [Bryobacterales bacterium]MBV9398818.1 hypothetical protein [Bryobacterales bacterium]